jgi:hypothetical protein
MKPDNDNRPALEASRVLPILGRVGPDGRLLLDRPLDTEILEFPSAQRSTGPGEV